LLIFAIVKKIVVIVLLLLYGFTTIGATIHLHYCMNKFVGWSLWHSDNDKQCEKCGMKEKKGGCCKDEHKQIKLQTEHEKGATAKYIQFVETSQLLTPIESYDFSVPVISVTHPTSHAPPKIPKERLYLLHCVFLI
jgi:hypothetical protein